jgi:hypothetical protein
MLYTSLILSAVLLIVVNRIVRQSEYAIPKAAALCFLFAFGPLVIMVFLPALFLQAAVSTTLLLLLFWPRHGKRLYLPLSCIAALTVYGLVFTYEVRKARVFVELREQYPFESMDSRLPHPPPTGVLKYVSSERLNRLEQEISIQDGTDTRTYALQRLHEMSVESFVNSPGFGVSRMGPGGLPNAQNISRGLQDTSPVPQPDYLKPFVLPTGTLTDLLPQWNATHMSRIHDNGVIDFVNARNFGFVKDRQHVAGFQRHGMTKVPTAEASAWSVARVDLVGLVVHDTPVVYVSANLPRMDELREAPTRPLDAFEMEALESLRNGEDLFTRGTDDTARMLGAIRATKQCVACHGGSRGDLLGAFSYGLRREGK